METVIGCTRPDGAKILFSSPETKGEDFRTVVDIYACGQGPWFKSMIPGYIRQLRESGEDGLYVVWARSFMAGMPPAAPEEKPEECFDIAWCVPLEAITDKILIDFIERSVNGPGGGGRPHHRGGCHGGLGHGRG